MERQVLVLADDVELCQSIQNRLQRADMAVDYTLSVQEALNDFLPQPYSLLIFDTSFETTDTLELLRSVRKSTPAPILVLVRKITAKEKVGLFYAGATACIEKPLDLSLCVAQANSLIQQYMEARSENQTYKPLTYGVELIIDPIYRQVIIDGERLILTRKEFDLLLCLARHPKQIWSRTQLYQYVWSDDLGLNGENTVRSHIGNLRKKLADVGKSYIQNCWGVGYKFVPPSSS